MPGEASISGWMHAREMLASAGMYLRESGHTYTYCIYISHSHSHSHFPCGLKR